MSSNQYTWTLEAYQQHGNLWLKWQTNAPFRAQQGRITVYKSTSFPSNPTDNVDKWSWDNENGGGSGWDTGLSWGSNWYCAWIAEKSPNGPYTYVTKLTTSS
ncbi:MAG TPA: hypothetical protein DDZ76_04295 [Xanthomonadales bacterium]|nr:hypothetical protein [Xanthomonadales bacterium]